MTQKSHPKRLIFFKEYPTHEHSIAFLKILSFFPSSICQNTTDYDICICRIEEVSFPCHLDWNIQPIAFRFFSFLVVTDQR